MVCEVNHNDSLLIPNTTEVPEDGFDDDEYEEIYASTNWTVRKTFLTLEFKEKTSQNMKLCRSDSWFIAGKSTTLNSFLHERSSCGKMCSSTSSTREPSQEDGSMKRTKSVRFAAVEEVHEMQPVSSMTSVASSQPSMISISSLKTDYSPVHQRRPRVASHGDDVFEVASLVADPFSLLVETDDEPTFGSILSIKTNYSDYSPKRRMPMDLMKDTRDNTSTGTACISDCSIVTSPASSVRPVSSDEGTPGRKDSGYADPTRMVQAVSVAPMVPLVPLMVWGPCTWQAPAKQSAPKTPPGKFFEPLKSSEQHCAPQEQRQRAKSELWCPPQEQKQRAKSELFCPKKESASPMHSTPAVSDPSACETAFAMRQRAKSDMLWCPKKRCLFPKHAMPAASDEEWEKRCSSRQASVDLVKNLEEYSRCLASGRQLPPAPDATDRTISKRRWEEQVMHFRHAVKRLAKTC